MIQRVYIDTSVVGGIYDGGFDVFTKMFFDKAFRGEIKLIISELLEEELINAPGRVKDFFRTLPAKQLELVRLTKEAIELAEMYINEKVVGETSRADCRHIALATLNTADVLVSWNFQHTCLPAGRSLTLKELEVIILLTYGKDFTHLKLDHHKN